jgi:phosphoenolpyruvate synthase/pyruvate phosphate dikinase
MDEEKKQQKQIQISVSPESKPIYANSVKINVTDEEVMLQFALVRPDEGRGVLVSELVLSPKHAMRFQKALDETLKKHFTRHLPKKGE